MQNIPQLIPLGIIDPPSKPIRLEPSDAEVQNLAESIKEIGLINALTVKPVGERYEVVAGHRRYLACKAAGLDEAACTVVQDIGTLGLVIMITENVGRLDLSPIEEAASVKELQDLQGWGYKLLAAHLGKSTMWVRDRLALLDLPPDITLLVHQRILSISSAIQLSRITDEITRKRYTEEALHANSSGATLKMWADLWEHAQQSPQGAINYDGGDRADLEAPKHLMACQLCDDRFGFEELRSLIVCKDCLKYLAEAKRENARVAANSQPDGKHDGAGLDDPARAQADEDRDAGGRVPAGG